MIDDPPEHATQAHAATAPDDPGAVPEAPGAPQFIPPWESTVAGGRDPLDCPHPGTIFQAGPGRGRCRECGTVVALADGVCQHAQIAWEHVGGVAVCRGCGLVFRSDKPFTTA